MAIADVFGYKRNPKPDGVFSSEDSTLTVGGGSGASTPSLVQNWTVDYTQDVQELFEIGSNKLYWAKGRPVGRGGIGRIVGAVGPDQPGGSGNASSGGMMPAEAFDICSGGATFVIKAVGGNCPQSPVTVLNKGLQLTMSGVVVTSMGFAMSVADVRIVENYAWRFGSLQLASA